MTSLMDVLETRMPAKVRAVKVFVRAAVCESSVHCGAGKESTMTARASSSPSDSLSETETAGLQLRPRARHWKIDLVHVDEVRLATLA